MIKASSTIYAVIVIAVIIVIVWILNTKKISPEAPVEVVPVVETTVVPVDGAPATTTTVTPLVAPE